MKNKQSAMTIATLANAVELGAAIMDKIDTDSLSQTYQGSEMGRQTTYDTMQVVIQQEIEKKIGA
jgi:hypothetical protein